LVISVFLTSSGLEDDLSWILLLALFSAPVFVFTLKFTADVFAMSLTPDFTLVLTLEFTLVLELEFTLVVLEQEFALVFTLEFKLVYIWEFPLMTNFTPVEGCVFTCIDNGVTLVLSLSGDFFTTFVEALSTILSGFCFNVFSTAVWKKSDLRSVCKGKLSSFFVFDCELKKKTCYYFRIN
jgi:hypothetical protein